MCLQCRFAANWKASSKNQKASSEEAEGFLQRSLGLHVHKLPKHCEASLTDLLEHYLCLPELHLCHLDLHFRWKYSTVTEVVSSNVHHRVLYHVMTFLEYMSKGLPARPAQRFISCCQGGKTELLGWYILYSLGVSSPSWIPYKIQGVYINSFYARCTFMCSHNNYFSIQ